jgi:anhydro-N-acetylmuramic acid kinase
VLNLGGIANFTALSSDPSKVLGFDTGPANSALDRLARILTGGAQPFDIDGALARSGTVKQELLQELIKSDAYLNVPPPKSTGFEVYGDSWVKSLIDRGGGVVTADLLATATEFAAVAIADALRRFILPTHPVSRVIAAGGGVNNLFLMERIASAIAPITLIKSDSLGVPSAAREAMAWAVLANDTVCGIPTSLPSVTGCSRELVQGKVAFPG